MRVATKGDRTTSGRWQRGASRCPVALVLLLAATPAAATDPGTRIDNIAVLRFTAGGVDQSVQSNTASIVVADRLDMTLVRSGSGPVPRDPRTTVAAVLTNTGSGHDAFAISTTLGATAAAGTIVAVDVDGNGQYDPAHDTLLPTGQTPALAPGASMALVVVADTSAVGTASLTIGAKAVAASGTPGTVAAGAGDGGSDAVVGPTGATGSFGVGIIDATTPPTLTKSQVIHAPDGSGKSVSGAVVTYTLDAAFAGPAAGVKVADPVPMGTRYVAGSLTLDGTALSDIADADAGQADGTAITVNLGAIPAAVTHRIQFQVQIQ